MLQQKLKIKLCHTVMNWALCIRSHAWEGDNQLRVQLLCLFFYLLLGFVFTASIAPPLDSLVCDTTGMSKYLIYDHHNSTAAPIVWDYSDLAALLSPVLRLGFKLSWCNNFVHFPKHRHFTTVKKHFCKKKRGTYDQHLHTIHIEGFTLALLQ